jgi:hypothetical protein
MLSVMHGINNIKDTIIIPLPDIEFVNHYGQTTEETGWTPQSFFGEKKNLFPLLGTDLI